MSLFNFKIIISIIILQTTLFSAATWSDKRTATQLASKITGTGIKITNPKITYGEGNQVGIFSDGIKGANLEIDEGIILTTMTVKQSFHANESPGYSVYHSFKDKDSDLLGIDSSAHYNTIVFEFDVTLKPNTTLLLLDYQFAAEEYNEYVGTIFNDAFGFFVSGGDLNKTYNIARVIDNNTYVTINNINNYDTVTVNNVNNGIAGYYQPSYPATGSVNYNNSQFFIDNDQNNQGGNSPITVEYDGLTHTLHATLDKLTPGIPYHFKMAIADTSDNQLNTGVFVNKIVGLRAPDLCYDYAYKQGNQYIPVDYNQSVGPIINASVSTSNPLEVAMYFRNTEQSDLLVSDVKLNILDINSNNQAVYKADSVYVTQPHTVFKQHIPDSNTLGMTAINNEILNIPINSFSKSEYFYTYFSVLPQVSNISLPLQARLNYNITIPLSTTKFVTVPRSSLIDKEIPICGDGMSRYRPLYRILNIVENGINPVITNGTNNLWYNLNTQIVNRTPKIALVPMDANNLDTVQDMNKSIGVFIDMIDLGTFHDTAASCSEESNSISKKTFTLLNANTSFTNITNLLPQEARKNAAFRISYNVDGNSSEVLTLTDAGTDANGNVTSWYIENFPNLSGSCLQNTGTIENSCKDAGTSNAKPMNKTELEACQRCIYGSSTKFICSRDNFSVRPEAFNIIYKDNNNTQLGQPSLLIKNNTSLPSDINLSAGYNYVLEINATTHLNTKASTGYIKGIETNYRWSPPNTKNISGCNDTTDKNTSVNLHDGTVNTYTIVNQVGDYSLTILDNTWTEVDGDLNYLSDINKMNHYLLPFSNHFLAGRDCVVNSDFVNNSNANDNLNGCNISSSHFNKDTNTTFTDLNMSFYPYRFDINGNAVGTNPIIPTVGLNFDNINNNVSYIYMADINNSLDENMSYHLNGTIAAVGENNLTLSNFVEKCYAQPLTISIQSTNRDLNDTNGQHVNFNFFFHDLNNTNTISRLNINKIDTAPVNAIFSLDLNESYFYKSSNGRIDTTLNLNYHRDANRTVNPKAITFISYNVKCRAGTKCFFNANMIANKTPEMQKDLNTTIPIKFYYGRSHSPRQKFVYPIGATTANPAVDFIYYEVYCNNNGGTTCDKTLLQNSATSSTTDDPRWFINTRHTSNFGTAGAITQKSGATDVTGTTATGNAPDATNLVYLGTKGYPLRTTMQQTPSSWLVYDKYNPAATTNDFDVEFINQSGSWAGKDRANSTTNSTGSIKSNRRSMW